MKITALLMTWIGTALILLFGWLIPWITYSSREGAITLAATAIRDEPDRAGFSAIPAFYASYAWIVIGVLIAACGLFAMFSGPRDRWFAVVAYVLCAAFLGLGAFGTYGDSSGRSSEETLTFYGALAAAVVMLLMAILSTRGAAFLGALPAALAALVGLAWSVWFVAAAPVDGPVEVSVLGWGLPAAHLVALLGALLSVAIAGRNKSSSGTNERRGTAPAAGPARAQY